MIDLYYWPTPNGHKIPIMLEECGLPYRVKPVNMLRGEQFEPAFLRINPNNKIPAIVDRDGPGGRPMALFESGAILQYLAEKTGRFLPRERRRRYEVLQWLTFQVANVGPHRVEPSGGVLSCVLHPNRLGSDDDVDASNGDPLGRLSAEEGLRAEEGRDVGDPRLDASLLHLPRDEPESRVNEQYIALGLGFRLRGCRRVAVCSDLCPDLGGRSHADGRRDPRREVGVHLRRCHPLAWPDWDGRNGHRAPPLDVWRLHAWRIIHAALGVWMNEEARGDPNRRCRIVHGHDLDDLVGHGHR
jgi:hypothetical protein